MMKGGRLSVRVSHLPRKSARKGRKVGARVGGGGARKGKGGAVY